LRFHGRNDDNKVHRKRKLRGCRTAFTELETVSEQRGKAMKVFEIMTIDVASCGLDDDLSRAASLMWEKDCGVIPVVDSERRVVGVVTDRDIAIATASQNRRPSEIKARDMLFQPIECCDMEDTIETVLDRMAKIRIRRLPVVGERCELLGMISIADVLKNGRKREAKQAVKTLMRIVGRPKARAADSVLVEP